MFSLIYLHLHLLHKLVLSKAHELLRHAAFLSARQVGRATCMQAFLVSRLSAHLSAHLLPNLHFGMNEATAQRVTSDLSPLVRRLSRGKSSRASVEATSE